MTPRSRVLTVLALVLLVMGLALAMVWAHWPWLEQAIATEEAPMAWLQSSLLWSCATLALLLALGPGAHRQGWVLLALLLLAAALDERFMGHERLKEWLLEHMFGGDARRMGLWGDLPMLGYALGGGVVLWWLRRIAWPRFERVLMGLAVSAGGVALVLDLSFASLSVQAVEECFELLAEALFLSGLLVHAQRQVQTPS